MSSERRANTIDKNIEKRYRFPVGLLNMDNQTKKEYFMNHYEPHNFLDKAVDKTIKLLNSPLKERLILVCGPSGVGKKEFIKEITRKLLEIYAPMCLKDPGCIPVVNVEATAPEQGSFDFSNLWKQTLANLYEPLINNKISYIDELHEDSNGQVIIRSKMSKANYQEVLYNALYRRSVQAVIINEAQHMLRVSTGKKVNWSADLAKSLTNRSETPIILVGTYALCTFLEDLDYTIIDQINLRTRVVEFPRYHDTSPEEVNDFAKTAKRLMRHMPLKQTPENLVDTDWRYFYDHSLGCIGTLKNWFMDAYSFAVDSCSTTLTLDHLNEAKLSKNRLEIVLASIEDGENRMDDLLSDGDLHANPRPIQKGSQTQGPIQNESQVNMKKNTVIRNSKPFERNTKRDPVFIR